MKDLMREEIEFPVVWHYHIIVESEDSECVEAGYYLTLTVGSVWNPGRRQAGVVIRATGRMRR